MRQACHLLAPYLHDTYLRIGRFVAACTDLTDICHVAQLRQFTVGNTAQMAASEAWIFRFSVPVVMRVGYEAKHTDFLSAGVGLSFRQGVGELLISGDKAPVWGIDVEE